jgi:hypothetical protein
MKAFNNENVCEKLIKSVGDSEDIEPNIERTEQHQ